MNKALVRFSSLTNSTDPEISMRSRVKCVLAAVMLNSQTAANSYMANVLEGVNPANAEFVVGELAAGAERHKACGDANQAARLGFFVAAVRQQVAQVATAQVGGSTGAARKQVETVLV